MRSMYAPARFLSAMLPFGRASVAQMRTVFHSVGATVAPVAVCQYILPCACARVAVHSRHITATDSEADTQLVSCAISYCHPLQVLLPFGTPATHGCKYQWEFTNVDIYRHVFGVAATPLGVRGMIFFLKSCHLKKNILHLSKISL